MLGMNDAELILSLGGPTVVARRLGYKLPDGARRVHNWMKRGIPAQVRLENQKLFKLPRNTNRPAAEA